MPKVFKYRHTKQITIKTYVMCGKMVLFHRNDGRTINELF